MTFAFRSVLQAMLLVSLFACGCGRKSAPRPAFSMSLESLLDRLTSVDAVAERPLGPSFLMSTYDRRGGNQDWAVWTNTDADGYVTLLDVDGPGYVSRIWRTNVKIKEWAFFIDGEAEPRLALTQDEMFGGNTFPFLSPLAGVSSSGLYSLVPIPFARHLRIAVKPAKLGPDTRNYFHINYTLLPEVSDAHQSWPRALSEGQSNAVLRAVGLWSENDAQLESVVAACLTNSDQHSVGPHETVTVFEGGGPGVLSALAVRIEEPTGGALLTAEVLRKLRLQMYWDGKPAPSVDVPLGDFFCNAFNTRQFTAYHLGNVNGTYVTRFPMPYKKGARCVIRNDGGLPVTLRVGVVNRDGAGRDLRQFHATWRASATSGSPFLMLETEGSGHYIGCFLTAIGQDGSWTILEGDEYLIADGNRDAAQYGTGLEDYFSGAYYYTSLFDLPQHGLIDKGAMRTDQYRFHGLEPVEFDKSFRMEIEFGDQNRARGYMSSVAYWYADRPHDVTIPDSLVPLLARPPDRFELAGFMAQLFMLERASLWDAAAVRCDSLAARYAHQPWAELLKLRAAAYRERLSGIDAVRADYERFASSTFAPVAHQARELLWFHENENHALLGMHVRGSYTLWVDGTEIDKAENRAVLRTRRLVLQPGRHEWEIDMTPTLQGSMASLCMRTHWGDIRSQGQWNIAHIEPLPGRKLPVKFEGNGALPNMTVWQFEPNAYVGMQSAKQIVTTWAFWDGRPMVKRVRLKQAWTNGPENIVVSEPATPIERSEAEERAHAID